MKSDFWNIPRDERTEDIYSSDNGTLGIGKFQKKKIETPLFPGLF